MRRVAVVINARSGGLLGRERAAEEVAERLAAAGLEPTILHEAEEPDLGRRLDRAVTLAMDAVIVGGGDGTIASAAQRLAGTGIALGILPLGTMNMLAKDLGIPLGLEAAAEALAQGERRSIDVAEVNGHVFLCLSVLGLPTAIGRHRERHRGQGGRMRLALAALRTVLRYPPLRLRVALDEEPTQPVLLRALAVANNAYSEGFGAIFSRTRLDRGELVVYRARDFGAWWIVKMLAAMALGAWRRRPELDERAARSIAIDSRRAHIRVMNDGEVLLLAPPLRYAIRPAALSVIVPARTDGAARRLAAAVPA